MNRLSMVTYFSLFQFGIVGLSLLFNTSIVAQTPITLQSALQIAESGSPSIQRSLLTVEQFQHNLNAERASLKSRFSLTLEPLSFSNSRIFDNQFSQWFTNTETYSRGTFQVEQPILKTGGTVGLYNTFGWRNNKTAIANLSEKLK